MEKRWTLYTKSHLKLTIDYYKFITENKVMLPTVCHGFSSFHDFLPIRKQFSIPTPVSKNAIIIMDQNSSRYTR